MMMIYFKLKLHQFMTQFIDSFWLFGTFDLDIPVPRYTQLHVSLHFHRFQYVSVLNSTVTFAMTTTRQRIASRQPHEFCIRRLKKLRSHRSELYEHFQMTISGLIFIAITWDLHL
jgi:hypothetical protein